MEEALHIRAKTLLQAFKGESYSFGLEVLETVRKHAARYGQKVLLIGNEKVLGSVLARVQTSLTAHGLMLAGGRVVPDAAPNTPREDVYRLATYILHWAPDCIVSVGGGSSIDAAKAANVLASLGDSSLEIDTYFGTGLVTEALRRTGGKLRPLVAVQTAASSGAHLTKYANITDPVANQKKLIVDEAIVPPAAVFDYSVTTTMPPGLTIDGALDGMAHCLEVFYGAEKGRFELIKEIASIGIELILRYTRRAVEDPMDLEAREALGLATDLGGYAIMVGGTNGAHLTSFSLVDIASHGRSCGLMNPYYTVFFAPAIQDQLQVIGEILGRTGYIQHDLGKYRGRELGIAVAEGLLAFARSVGAPTRLSELPGFSPEHIKRALQAGKDPQLEMKLKNMPVPLTADLVDEYMAPILAAAESGDFDLIKNLEH